MYEVRTKSASVILTPQVHLSDINTSANVFSALYSVRLHSVVVPFQFFLHMLKTFYSVQRSVASDCYVKIGNCFFSLKV